VCILIDARSVLTRRFTSSDHDWQNPTKCLHACSQWAIDCCLPRPAYLPIELPATYNIVFQHSFNAAVNQLHFTSCRTWILVDRLWHDVTVCRLSGTYAFCLNGRPTSWRTTGWRSIALPDRYPTVPIWTASGFSIDLNFQDVMTSKLKNLDVSVQNLEVVQ